MPDVTFLIIAGASVLVGAAVQTSVGLGLALVAAPVVSMLDPALMPGAVLITTALLPVLTLLAEWRHIDLRGMSWALAGRLVGTGAGVWVVANLTPRSLALLVGVMVLVAVVLTATAVRVRPTPRALSFAGVISGLSGTATSIGGPPIALVYQQDPGPRVRSTLGAYFLVGVVVSMAALAFAGQLDSRDAAAGTVLLPFVLAGFLLARPLRRIVDGHFLRAALLAVVTASGVVLIVHSLLSGA